MPSINEIQNHRKNPPVGTFRVRSESIGEGSKEGESFVADSLANESVSKTMVNGNSLKAKIEFNSGLGKTKNISALIVGEINGTNLSELVKPNNNSALIIGDINGENCGLGKVKDKDAARTEEEVASEVSGSLLGHAQRSPTKCLKVRPISTELDCLSPSPKDNNMEGCWAASPDLEDTSNTSQFVGIQVSQAQSVRGSPDFGPVGVKKAYIDVNPKTPVINSLSKAIGSSGQTQNKDFRTDQSELSKLKYSSGGITLESPIRDAK